MVTKGPPSSGQLTICGNLSICVFPYKIGVLNRDFKGRAPIATPREPIDFEGDCRPVRGFERNSTKWFTGSSVARKIKRERLKVPNKLDTAENLLFLTFSNYSAGPW